MKKTIATVITAVGAVALLGVGLGIGSAFAEVPNPSPTSKPDAYNKNADGATFGVIGESTEPELIGVYATNGKQGYVWKAELDMASGSPNQFSSPEEALAWQAEFGHQDRSVAVYDSDGKTVIGEFVIVGIDGQKTENAN